MQCCLERAPQPKDILFLMAYDDKVSDYGAISETVNRTYAEANGYDFRVVRSGFDSGRPPSWEKIRFILEGLRSYRWVFWCDADALVMNHTIRLESFLDGRHDFIFGQHEIPFRHVNCGVFFARDSIFGRAFLRGIWRQTAYISHGWWEQGAIVRALSVQKYRRVRLVSGKCFNALPAIEGDPIPFEDGDFVLHFAGRQNKPAMMRSYLPRIVGLRQPLPVV